MTHEPFTGFLQGNIPAQRQQRPDPTELPTHEAIAHIKEEDRPAMCAEGDPVNPDPLEGSIHTPASLTEGMEAHISDPVNPDHYRGFSNNAEVIDITENLTGNGAAAVKYLARACRLDGQNKGQIIEDLKKSLWYTRRELSRLQEASDE